MEFLKELFGDQALTFEDFSKAAADRAMKLADLSGGQYVSKDKYEAKEKELETVESQLEDANRQIEDFKGMDIERVKQAAEEWKTKYDEAKEEAQRELAKKEYEFAAKEYLSGFSFASELAKKAVLNEFVNKEFKLDNGKFMGADDYIESLKESDPGAFISSGKNPVFTKGGTGQSQINITREDVKKMTYTERLKLKTEQPDIYQSLAGKE